MKKFYKFTSIFTFLIFIIISELYFVKFINNVINYLNEQDKTTKAAIAILMESNLITSLMVLTIGLVLSSIVSLLIKISYKNDK